ncbi:hypothetical protein FIU88_00880 [Halomonas sp. THAF12]|nr:hypothetical protein FIU88_00880 [Halomonas sp. THAF12]
MTPAPIRSMASTLVERLDLPSCIEVERFDADEIDMVTTGVVYTS